MTTARIKVKSPTRRSPRKASLAAVQPGLSHDVIAREAYLIWEHSGRPEDRALEHWLEAEQRLCGSSSASA